MPIHHEGLRKEFESFVVKEGDRVHIAETLESGDPLLHEIAYNLITGKHLEIDRLVKEALESGYEANALLDYGLIAGMAIVGVTLRDNIIFVPEVLISFRALMVGMSHIEPLLSASGVKPLGIVIMGTVKGDLHDIGKNLLDRMLVDVYSHRGSGLSMGHVGFQNGCCAMDCS